MNFTDNIFEEWDGLFKEGKLLELKMKLNEDNAANIAEFFEETEKNNVLTMFRLLSKDIAAEVFSYMDSDLQEYIVNLITDSEVKNIVEDMSLDDAVDFLGEVPANLVTRVLKNTDAEKRDIINQFLNYPADSAGSIMTIEFMQFHEQITVGEAILQIKTTGFDKETIYSCYVINESKVLEGVVSLRSIVLASPEVKIKDIMEDDVIYVKTLDDQEYVADIFKKYSFMAVPVTDNERRLVGIITVDDIVDVIEEENTEDIEKMSGLIPADEEYLKTSVLKLAKNRILWLFVLMISGTISSLIINNYEAILASSVILTAFFPILMDTGGNAGSQSSTLIIRGMAVGEIETKDTMEVLWKEVRVGLISGICLATVNFVRLIITKTDLYVNLAVSISLIFTVVLSKSIGCILPILAKKLKLDPAIMAGPLITTISDAISLIIFFNLARYFVL